LGTACFDEGIPAINSPRMPSVCYNGRCVKSRTTQCRSINNNQNPNESGCDISVNCAKLECTGNTGLNYCPSIWSLSPNDGTPCGASRFCLGGLCKSRSEIPGGGTDPTPKMMCPTGSVNIRSGAGTQYSVIWLAAATEAFEVLNTQLSWALIRAKAGPRCGQSGWALTTSFAACTKAAQC
jgi:uncharacterized protein YgiM (DUF1202 family)